MSFTTGAYAVTVGPLGRVPVQDCLVQGAFTEHAGRPVSELLERVEARAQAVQ